MKDRFGSKLLLLAAALALGLSLAGCSARAVDAPPAARPMATPLEPPAVATATVAPAPAPELPAAAQNRDFPPIVAPPDNPTTPEKVELGRQLFFDPVLSANDAMSCATCHHPDLGFSNGDRKSVV